MEDLLIETLENAYNCPVVLQGSLGENEPYPNRFFTYWNDAADGAGFYSNKENAIIWQYSVNFYGTDPNEVNTMLLDAKQKLKAVGFIVTGAGYSVASDEPAHTGRGISVLYRQD